MVDFFIRRPVFATVCALLIILAGAVCIPTLPISLYPTVGAAAGYGNQQLRRSECAGGRVRGHHPAGTADQWRAGHAATSPRPAPMTEPAPSPPPSKLATTWTSPPSTYRIASRPRRAACPQAVNNTGITITKANSNFVFAAAFFSPDNRYSDLFISNYLDVYVKDALKRIPGVGDVVIFGERRYAMRVWLDPARLAARGLTSVDVTNALAEQNVEIPAGQVGQPPSDEKQSLPDSRCA